MTSYADAPIVQRNPLQKAEGWLDQRGRFAWIAAMVAGFIFVWPVGLALLGYMVWQNKFSLGRSGSCGMRKSAMRQTPTGNAAFDAYRADTLRRLEEEQAAFEDFLKRLREARDKAEFDQFMEDRDRKDNTPDAA
ncbi:hypothetical protein PARPLA_02466 [Rhodobacteraceae bacterium THAF1]|uniref:DUF2852 domain-containing protein n=1 Tax=Palleronia sp. THAF1 TaxID=2587842 RepID=UPI000F416735|nr:DUF2852 domain-containing protein [Palleronia sp. THAF1]QFU07946.1 hypothetical protein FIU81_04605 [Palleronia sp. THAF1]VDC27796.1 hypothetical protein PARPLA_02466 [Rhodobacteraceae bacterium THAF1]